MNEKNYLLKTPFYSSLGLLWAMLLVCTVLLGSCKDDDIPSYTVPETYTFTNVDYSGQITRLNMVEEMVTLMKSGNAQGTMVDAQVLKDMFANENAPFADPALNSTTKNLISKCFYLDTTLYKGYIDSLAAASNSQTAGTNGTAGVVQSTTDPSKEYLFAANGMEYTQLIEKGLMGAVMYYQITEVYLGTDQIGPGVDNITITDGQGTDMEHHWDEAFGYFGVPTDFPLNTAARFIGKYCQERDALLGSSAVLMNAFLQGRAAISNGDMTTKEAQIPFIRDELEKVFAATAIHYLNHAKANIGDDAIRNHDLSEAIAFIRGLLYNPTRHISPAEIDTLLASIGDNLYTVTLNGLDAARNQLSSTYGMDAIKDLL